MAGLSACGVGVRTGITVDARFAILPSELLMLLNRRNADMKKRRHAAAGRPENASTGFSQP